MSNFSLEGCSAFEAVNIMLGFLLKLFPAVWATAIVDLLPLTLEREGPLPCFFRQARWADNYVTRSLEVSPGLLGKQVSTPLATELVLFAIMTVYGRTLFADSESYQ